MLFKKTMLKSIKRTFKTIWGVLKRICRRDLIWNENRKLDFKNQQSFWKSQDFKDLLDEKYKYREISPELKGVIGPEDIWECPKCSKNIPLIMGDKCECPKCGGELYGCISILYD